MSYPELFLLAIGLCFDTFAISLSGGICLNLKLKWFQILRIIFVFAFFQAGFALLGWFLGSSVQEYIEKFDHWVAFLLLLYIGGKMVLESVFKKDDECNPNKINLLDVKKLSILSIATSIDALAVGISLALLRLSSLKIGMGILIIFCVTALASLAGLLGGKSLGKRFGKRSECVGGAILILIGIKILVEHLIA
jgi:manganese efflux pump family protein